MQLKHLALTGFLAAAAAQSQSTPDLPELLSSTPELSNLTTYLQLFPDLVEQLSQASNITILAPSDDAFSELLETPAGEAITANDSAAIQALLTYHVLNGVFAAEDVPETAAFIPTLLEDPDFTTVNGGQVVQALRDGDSVEFTSGLKAVSTVSQADVNFTGGVVHIIDKVLTVPANLSTTAIESNLTSLAGALIRLDLLDALDTTPELTVFAPNNEAFQNIGSALGNLTDEELTAILTYHVLNGTVAYSSTLEDTTVETSAGSEVTITIDDDRVFVNGAEVVLADVLVANGVVHVIDNVLNPENSEATPDPTQSTQSPAFSDASAATEAPFTSDVPTPTGTLGGGDATATDDEDEDMVESTNAADANKGSLGMVALMGAGAALLMA